MLIAETRPSRRGGVTDWRSVVVLITHRIGPAPSRKKPRPASNGVGKTVVSAITAEATKPVTGPSPIDGAERQPAHDAGRSERADHHADAVHRQGGADAARRQAEMAHGIGHEDREDQEPGRAEDELGDEDRPQQGMAEDELRALADLLQRMAALRRQPRRLVDARQQHDRDHRQRRGKAERRAGADPADQQAAQRRTAGEGDRARELDAAHWPPAATAAAPATAPAPARRRCRRRCRTPRRSPGSASSGRVIQPSTISASVASNARRPQRLGARHQPAARQAVGQQAGRNGEQHERQGERGLQQAGLALAGAEQQHGDDRRGGERHLLGRLRGEIGPGETIEGRRQLVLVGRVMGAPGLLARNLGSLRRPLYPRAASYCYKAR